MGSPRRNRPSKLRGTEIRDMRIGSIAMDPCVVASPSKKDNGTTTANNNDDKDNNNNNNKSNDRKTGDGPSPKSPGGSNAAAPLNEALFLPNRADAADASSGMLRLPMRTRSPRSGGGDDLGDSTDAVKSPSRNSTASTRSTRRRFSLPRLSGGGGSKQRREARQQQKRQQKRELRQREGLAAAGAAGTEGRHPEESTSTTTEAPSSGAGSSGNSNGSSLPKVVVRPVLSPASTVQTAKSNPGSGGGKRRKGKPGIKFLKRALSSPPVLLQRFHSNPIEKHHRASPDNLPHAGSTSSNSSSNFDVDLNPNGSSSNNNNNNNMADRTLVVPKCYSPASKTRPKALEPIRTDCDDDDDDAVNGRSRCNATSILHHTYLPVLESICGSPDPDALRDDDDDEDADRRLVLPPEDRNDLRRRYRSRHPADASTHIPEDPTVQESIECIFASQLEDGLTLWDDDDDDGGADEHDDDDSGAGGGGHRERRSPRGHRSFESLEKVRSASSGSPPALVSPAGVQQSRMNRKDRKGSTRSLFDNMPQTKKRYEQASLVYVGTFDPSTPKNRSLLSTRSGHHHHHASNASVDGGDACGSSTVYSNLPTDPLPCSCASSFLPYVEPSAWPQAPIALRPTPGGGTRIRSIRFSGSSEPLWVPGSHLTWSQRLRQHWGRPVGEEPHYASCEECVVLPINNGNEAPGESVVVDFESELFEGTMMLRLRYANGTTPEPYDDSRGYFAGMNRRYQLCIRGRFKKVIPFTELTTGFKLGRQIGKLPSKWIIKGTVKVVSFFAPQLDIKLEGVDRPYSLTPLGSTPQCINVDDGEDWDGRVLRDSAKERRDAPGGGGGSDAAAATAAARISNARMNELDGVRVESTDARRSVLGIAGSEENTSLQRSKTRKKAFDKLFAEKSKLVTTDPSKIYTFEFLQHMINFQDFSLELGNMVGSVKLEELLDGQPLPIMASHGDEHLWSFDVWNECLWKRATEHEKNGRLAATTTSQPRCRP